jgi:hypothetical protein
MQALRNPDESEVVRRIGQACQGVQALLLKMQIRIRFENPDTLVTLVRRDLSPHLNVPLARAPEVDAEAGMPRCACR